jgi:hypothetical protein
VVTLLALGSLTAYADWKPFGMRLLMGAMHTAVHVAAASLPAWAIAHPMGESGGNWIAAAALGSAALGFVAGGFLFGAYVLATHRKAHNQTNEVLACQGIPDYKNFLRMRIRKDFLTIYPIGIRKVPRKWVFSSAPAEPDSPAPRPEPGPSEQQGEPDPSAPWLEPADGEPALSPFLIEEEPIKIASPPPAPRPADSPK